MQYSNKRIKSQIIITILYGLLAIIYFLLGLTMNWLNFITAFLWCLALIFGFRNLKRMFRTNGLINNNDDKT